MVGRLIWECEDEPSMEKVNTPGKFIRSCVLHHLITWLDFLWFYRVSIRVLVASQKMNTVKSAEASMLSFQCKDLILVLNQFQTVQ